MEIQDVKELVSFDKNQCYEMRKKGEEKKN